MQGADRFGVGSIEDPAAIAALEHQADVAQHAEMFRNRRLRQMDVRHNITHRPFPEGKIAQDFAAPRLGSATALKASDVVAARGMYSRLYSYIGICQS